MELTFVDANVAVLHQVGPAVAISADEDTKTVEGALSIIDKMIEHEATEVRAIGGGTIQDAVGFACSIYKRGIPWIFEPTTLLAQADSCIGAKTSINYRETKNVLGSFHEPKVVLHRKYLTTLPQREVMSGLGEVFKLAVLGGQLERYREQVRAAIAGDLDALVDLRSLAHEVKLPIVERDPFDRGERRKLNLGHTIGHAIEAVTNYHVPHGTAVCFGLLVETDVMSWDSYPTLVKDAQWLLSKDAVKAIGSVDLATLLETMRRDKKVKDGTLQLMPDFATALTEEIWQPAWMDTLRLCAT